MKKINCVKSQDKRYHIHTLESKLAKSANPVEDVKLLLLSIVAC